MSEKRWTDDERDEAFDRGMETMQRVALELYRRGREPLLEELEEARARNADMRAMLEQVTRERDEARAEVERLRAEADRWKRLCNVFRERDWPKAFQATVTSLEQEVSDAHEQLAKLRRLSKPWEGTAYRRGAEAMRARCEELVKHNSHEDGIGMGSQRIESAIRALTISEEP